MQLGSDLYPDRDHTRTLMNAAETGKPRPQGRRPVRVCLLVDTVKYDAGTEKLVAEFARRINSHLFEVHVCCFEESARLTDLRSHVRTEVFPLERLYSPAGLYQLWRFRQYLERNRMDVVHGFMSKSSVFGVLAAIRSHCPVVVTSRLNTGYWYTPALLRVFRLLNSFTTHILTNSARAKNTTVTMEKVSPEKITVVYPGVDLVRYAASSGNRSTAGIPSEFAVVGIVATFRPVKDLPLFLRTAHIVLNALPNTAFLLVGHGDLKADLEHLATELGIRSSVFFSDPVGAVPDYLARMSIACLTSESEGLPNAILEYMAAGLPVVATDVGGVSELVEDGVTGYLVRDRSPAAVAEPIIRLLKDDHLRTEMGQKGLERARTQFDISAAVRRLEDFYIAALRDRGAEVQPLSGG